jgi:hypothetical protein
MAAAEFLMEMEIEIDIEFSIGRSGGAAGFKRGGSFQCRVGRKAFLK